MDKLNLTKEQIVDGFNNLMCYEQKELALKALCWLRGNKLLHEALDNFYY